MRFRRHVTEFFVYHWPELFYFPFNQFHYDVLDEEKEAWSNEREEVRDVNAAPRGIAKTTLSKGDVVHDIVYSLEKTIVVISAERKLATRISKGVRTMIGKSGSKLWNLYGRFSIDGTQQEYGVVNPYGHETGVLSMSFGSQVRGIDWNGSRPTKILMDDCERSNRVRSAEQRDIHWEFLTEDILESIVRYGSKVILNGTLLHVESSAANLLKNPGWRARLYKGVIKWPENTKLWEECEKVWANLEDKNRKKTAKAFYEAHKEEMDKGSEVLDPVALPIYLVYTKVWTNGWSAVLKEIQNDPRSSLESFFQVDKFKKFRLEGNILHTARGKKIDIRNLKKVAFLDPIPGKELDDMTNSGRVSGDYAAIVIAGKDEHGYVYILDCWLRRARDNEQLEALLQLCEFFEVNRAGIESNQAQRLFGTNFRRILKEREEKDEFHHISVLDVNHSTEKESRIATLEVPAHHGWIEFNEALPVEFYTQFRNFGSKYHNDGPDATEGAYSLLGYSIDRDKKHRAF